MAVNKLIYNGAEYSNELTANVGRLNMDHAMVGETLSVDTLYMPVIIGDLPVRMISVEQDEEDWIVSSDGYELCLTDDTSAPVAVRNAPGYYYFNDNLVGKYYLQELRQIAEYEYAFTFYSAIKLLGQSKHKGGLYTGETAGEVIADIMGGVPYTVDEDVAEIQVYGYLPYDWRRLNLQKLLMAIGAAVRNAGDGSLRITSLSDTVVGTFGADRVFVGGTVIDKNPASAVQVTEHNFIPSEDEVVLYENTTYDTETIIFSEPYHDLDITNGTIIESGVNYCTFEGAGAVIITGKKYIHVTRLITVGEITGNEDEIVKSVTENTLINPFNATEVAERLYDFLTVAQSIRQEVIFGHERPGDVVKVYHPYTRQLVDATIKSMSITMGYNQLRAYTEFLVGYIPPSLISGFTNYTVLTGSGEWTVPEGVTKIRVIIVGAGSGGAGGKKGQKGPQITSDNYGGEGGEGGEGGAGGLILEINMIVAPSAHISYSCGSGGTGGNPDSQGTAGTNTIFGSYSSALGRQWPDGYTEPKTGMILGKSGNTGIKGGRGRSFFEDAEEDIIEYDGMTYYPGQNGATEYRGGDNAGYAIGGGGGGAAVGSNGANGTDGVWRWANRTGYYGDYRGYWADHGNGGKGADATIDGEDGASYGCGGSGGHGGGGGGWAAGNLPHFDHPGTPGQGGNGSKGGDGADGCVIVYY